MKLTKDQIYHIKNKIEKKGFKYKDVQAEILDHMASSIEERITKNPNLSVDEAYDLTYKELGIFAFSNFEDSMRKKIKSELLSSFVTCFKSLFTTIKVFIPIVSFLLIFFLKNFFPNHFLNICYSMVIGLPTLIGLRWYMIYKKNKFLKKYLSFRILVGIHFSVFYLMLNIHFFSKNFTFLATVISIYIIIQLTIFYSGHSILDNTKRFNKLLRQLS